MKEKQLVTFVWQTKQTLQTPGTSFLPRNEKDWSLLYSVIILINDSHGNKIRLRSILHLEYSINVSIRRESRKLKIYKGNITGINESKSKSKTYFKCKSTKSTWNIFAKCAIFRFPKLTNYIPVIKLDILNF